MIGSHVSSIKTGIKANILTFQEKSELKYEDYQIEDENTEDQSVENLDAKSDLEEMSNKGTPIELGNKSLVAVLSQEYLSMDVPH